MADMTTYFAGLKFRNPVLPGSGPPVRDWREAKRAIDGGCGALVTKTISVVAADVPMPNMAEIRNGFLNTELWSELTPEHWLEHEYPVMRKLCDEAGIPMIVGIGYKAHEIEKLAPLVAPYADALELSTHYLPTDLTPMQDAIRAAKQYSGGLPVFSKMSPGGREVVAAALAAEEAGADGLTVINSFGPCFGVDIETGNPVMGSADGYGWLSGGGLKPIALRCVYDIARHTNLPIFGVGGVSRGEDAIEFLQAGATAVQICTAAIVRGNEIFGKVARQMEEWMDKRGFKSPAELTGRTVRLMNARPFYSTYRMKELPIPTVLKEKCTGCGICVTSCVYECIVQPAKKAVISIVEPDCWRCGLCITRCPPAALVFETAENEPFKPEVLQIGD